MLDLRPNAVTLEKRGAVEADEVSASSYEWAVLGQKYDGVNQLMIQSSTEMMNMFRLDFFRPRVSLLYKPLHGLDTRREDTGLHVPLNEYAAIMVRRVKNQFRAEWSFSYILSGIQCFDNK